MPAASSLPLRCSHFSGGHRDREVLQPAEHLGVGPEVEAGEVEERERVAVADVEEEVRGAAVVAVLEHVGERELEQVLVEGRGALDVGAEQRDVVHAARRRLGAVVVQQRGRCRSSRCSVSFATSSSVSRCPVVGSAIARPPQSRAGCALRRSYDVGRRGSGGSDGRSRAAPGAGSRNPSASYTARAGFSSEWCRNGVSPRSRIPCTTRAVIPAPRPRRRASGCVHTALTSVAARQLLTFAGHRHEPVAVEHAVVVAELDRARPPRARLRERDQRGHLRLVVDGEQPGVGQRDVVEVRGRSRRPGRTPSGARCRRRARSSRRARRASRRGTARRCRRGPRAVARSSQSAAVPVSIAANTDTSGW